MAGIDYYWTADGEPERCSVRAANLAGETCYHCAQPIDGRESSSIPRTIAPIACMLGAPPTVVQAVPTRRPQTPPCGDLRKGSDA